MIDGNHATTARIGIIPVQGQGEVQILLNDVEVTGKISLSVIDGGYLNIDSFELEQTVGSTEAHLNGFGVLDTVVSNAVTSALDGIVNTTLNAFNLMISNVFVPAANSILNTVSLVDVLWALIGAIINPNVIDLVAA